MASGVPKRVGRLTSGRTADLLPTLHSVKHELAAQLTASVAYPAGFEPTTPGLGIRIDVPARVQRRDVVE